MATVTSSNRATQRQIPDSVTVDNITIHAACIIAQVSRDNIYKLMQAGKFPKQHHTASGGVRWAREEVLAWAGGTWKP